MRKADIESILLANNYLVSCKFCKSDCTKIELAQKFLTQRIKKTLNKRIITDNKNSLFKVFSFFLLNLIVK